MRVKYEACVNRARHNLKHVRNLKRVSERTLTLELDVLASCVLVKTASCVPVKTASCVLTG